MKKLESQSCVIETSPDFLQSEVVRKRMRWTIETSKDVPFVEILAKLKKMYEITIQEEDVEIFRTVCTELWKTPPRIRQRTKIECGNLSPATRRYISAVIYMVQENHAPKKRFF